MCAMNQFISLSMNQKIRNFIIAYPIREPKDKNAIADKKALVDTVKFA